MHILISNDDGALAKGVNILAQTLSSIAQITVVTPDRNRSGASNSLTLESPLRLHEVAPNRFAVQGTPVDCVHLALSELANEKMQTIEPSAIAQLGKVDLVISGINHGANLGDDVLYSGTVAAATEGHFFGLPAIAVSLCGKTHFATAAEIVKKLVVREMKQPFLHRQIININVPDLPLVDINGQLVTRLGRRQRSGLMLKETDPRGHDVFWIGGIADMEACEEGTDFYAIEHGYVSITPLQIDMTAHDRRSPLSNWLEEEIEQES